MTAATRTSGILLHVTSLPSRWGVGDFGPEAYRFVDFLQRTGQGVWQVLPLGPPGYGNSPYQCFSAFAGNPLLISLDLLGDEGLLDRAALNTGAQFPVDRVDFERVGEFHRKALDLSYARFQASGSRKLQEEFAAFVEQESRWLDAYALFMALKEAHANVAWTEWPKELVHREPAALAQQRSRLADAIGLHQYIQFQFFRQWAALKAYAHAHGVHILGDVPIFVAHDSADVWSQQDEFELDSDGRPTVVAGVPPDYFSADGQLWGNPLYRWRKMEAEGYAWWIERLRAAFAMFDSVRLDHFRGFESYWEVPGQDTTARNGRWVPGPRASLFRAAAQKLGKLPLVAEDLGVITPEVDALRDELGFPGMRVLQFAFGSDPKAREYQPHNYIRNCVAYTGTHDNDTAVGWFRSEAGDATTRTEEEVAQERAFTLGYLASDGRHIARDLIRAALASVADLAIFPMQDLLELGGEARMNLPGTSGGNWAWRLDPRLLTPEVEQRLADLTWLYERGVPRRSGTMPTAAAEVAAAR